MAKTKARKPKRVRPSKVRQEVIAEMKPQRHDDVEVKAHSYVSVRDQRMELTKQETACKEELLKAMHDAGETVYETEDGLIVQVVDNHKEDVKVKRKNDASENGDGE